MSMLVSALNVAKLTLRIRNEPQADGARMQVVALSMSDRDGKDVGFLVATHYAKKGEQDMDVQITPAAGCLAIIESDDPLKGERE